MILNFHSCRQLVSEKDIEKDIVKFEISSLFSSYRTLNAGFFKNNFRSESNKYTNEK